MSFSVYSRKMSNGYGEVPIGVRVIARVSQRCCPRFREHKNFLFKASIFILTYISYTCYHMTRKPISVVKSVLHGNCTVRQDQNDCGYEPFDRPDAQTLFGTLDSSFLFSYAAAMFLSGFIAERVSLRYFLAFGMILSGIFTYLFGIAKMFNIHNIWYFVAIQACAGIFQTTGWPGVVTLVGRWFGKSKRGLIFGIWNSHTSIGNILGTLIAANYVETDWSMSFIIPGIIMAAVGFVLFLFLVDSPEIVGCQPQSFTAQRNSTSDDVDFENRENSNTNNSNYDGHNGTVSFRPSERTPILQKASTSANGITMERPVGLLDALAIPGVTEYSFCLFFSKLVSYTFLYWLPLYIGNSTTLSPKVSADLSTLFDVGGILGAITSGMISDYTGMPASTCAIMLLLASPVLLLYQFYGATSLLGSIVLLLIAGVLVNGPYALITTSVSAELGQHSSLEGNAKALATVTAIIDGTGSIGAAVGPLLAGVISVHGWQRVFCMLIVADILAMLLLVRLVIKEIVKLRPVTRTRIE